MKPKNELSAEEAAVLLGKKKPWTEHAKHIKAHVGMLASDDHETHVKAYAEARGSKFHNRKTTIQTFFGEQTFDSIKESRCFQKLELALKAGHYRLLLCQVPFRLPGKTKYVADFLAISQTGEVHILDAKGMKTAMYQLKKRQVEEIYKIQIEEL